MSTVAPFNRDLYTAALMGFTAGYTTSNTKVRFNTFGGMMTGNTVKVQLKPLPMPRLLTHTPPLRRAARTPRVQVGISLQQQRWGWAGVYMLCIALFAVGTVFALFMIQKLGAQAQRAFLLVFMVSFLLVDGLALALKDEDPIYSSLVSSLAAFALGAPQPARALTRPLTPTLTPTHQTRPHPRTHPHSSLTLALTPLQRPALASA